MSSHRLLPAFLLGLLVAPGHAQQPGDDQVSLTFGVYQSDRATKMYRSFIPVLDALQPELERRLGRPADIQLRIFKTYDDAIDALVDGDIDFVRFGPSSYITAYRKNRGIKLLAMEHEEGKKRFLGAIIVRTDSEIQKLQDLAGRSFAFGDPNSTIGRWLSQAELAKAGITAKTLGKYAYLDRHDKVAKAVEYGEYDAGAVKIETYEKLAPRGKLRTIATFENVTKPWVARADLPAEIFKALAESLIDLRDPQALKELGVSGFCETSDAEYAFVREGMAHAEEFSN